MSSTYPVFIMQIDTNTQLIFKGEQVKTATLVEEIHPISLELPISTLEFDILFQDDSFSMFGGEYFDLLAERLPINAWEVVDGVYVYLGKFYLTDWENISEREFSFKAMDIIGILDETTFDGYFIEPAADLDDILDTILEPLNVDYEIHADVIAAMPSIQGWIEPSNYREAIQQICFASGTIASSMRSDKLNILPANLPIDSIGGSL